MTATSLLTMSNCVSFFCEEPPQVFTIAKIVVAFFSAWQHWPDDLIS